MKTKEKLLTLFEKNRGVYFSGEEIAEKLSVSRTAVWKAVNSLRREGYGIHAVQNKGYCLAANTDILSVQGIQKYLESACSQIKLTVLPAAASTNALLREEAAAGAPEGCVLIAGSQTNGRGRTGRSFYSPPDTGLYMSLLLRPSRCPAQKAKKYTIMAAVAACHAIESLSDKKPVIKWGNDIYMDGKKVSGILTEASVGLEDGFLDYVILGIGINVYSPQNGFPDELKDKAGAVFSEAMDDGKNRLAAAFLNCFMTLCQSPESPFYKEDYRKRSFLIGKKILVLLPEGTKKAAALDIDEDCRLIVRYEDGTIAALDSGEVRTQEKCPHIQTE